ncbi:MAG: hypothetical protein SAJ37_07245 [Oscillatoria sp. PMC 1068.18]|nr:hypothetical protein [Oscillatoria sp. PMC 1076.18]MEC4988528.1 hypothetical protein [Oscillatoria sp. PMC 1068.18]
MKFCLTAISSLPFGIKIEQIHEKIVKNIANFSETTRIIRDEVFLKSAIAIAL